MQTSEIMEEEDVSPKVSLKRNGSFICVAAPFLYDKLPEEPLKLTILKLDGSSFDIEVARNGSVEDLKRAVVEAFSHCKVSWLHVWGHFCLSYSGQKLLSDDDLIGTYGIKDGDESGKGDDDIGSDWKRGSKFSIYGVPGIGESLDQEPMEEESRALKMFITSRPFFRLSFVRLVSIGYNPEKTQSEGEEHQFDEARSSNGFDDKELKGEAEDNNHQDDSENDEDNISKDENNGGVLGSCQNRFHLFRGLFSYQKLENPERRVEQKTE